MSFFEIFLRFVVSYCLSLNINLKRTLIAFLTNSFLLSREPTMGENLVEPSFHPPMASIVFKFLLYVFNPVNLA